MNIFYTNKDSKICASEHCKIHTRKMIVEYSQMLSSAHRILDGDDYANKHNLYRLTHKNHPCSIWVRSSAYHYEWLYNLYVELCNIYKINRNIEHRSSQLIEALFKIPDNIEFKDFIDPPKAMPEEIQKDSTIESYKDFILSKYKQWTTRKDKKRLVVDWYTQVPNWVSL